MRATTAYDVLELVRELVKQKTDGTEKLKTRWKELEKVIVLLIEAETKLVLRSKPIKRREKMVVVGV